MTILKYIHQWWRTNIGGSDIVIILCPICGKSGILESSITDTGETTRPACCPHTKEEDGTMCEFVDIVKLEGWEAGPKFVPWEFF